MENSGLSKLIDTFKGVSSGGWASPFTYKGKFYQNDSCIVRVYYEITLDDIENNLPLTLHYHYRNKQDYDLFKQHGEKYVNTLIEFGIFSKERVSHEKDLGWSLTYSVKEDAKLAVYHAIFMRGLNIFPCLGMAFIRLLDKTTLSPGECFILAHEQKLYPNWTGVCYDRVHNLLNKHDVYRYISYLRANNRELKLDINKEIKNNFIGTLKNSRISGVSGKVITITELMSGIDFYSESWKNFSNSLDFNSVFKGKIK